MTDPDLTIKDTLEEFLERYDIDPRVVDVSTDGEKQWVVFQAGDTAVVVSATFIESSDDAGPHLSLDAHAFRGGQVARIGVFLMEDGKRYEIADHPATPGTSHRWSAARGATLLVGDQRPHPQVPTQRDPGDPGMR